MRRAIIIILLFMVLITILTFPLCFKINNCIPGFFSTDETFGTIWNSWRIKYSWENKISLQHTDLLVYPFGFEFRKDYYPFFGDAWFQFLRFCAGPILSFNLQVLINLFLSAFLCYLLVFYLTKNMSSAILSGIIFGFCPYQFARAWQHLGLTYNQWLPLSLLAAFTLRDNLNKKNSLMFLGSLLLLFSFDFSIMYFGAVLMGSFCFYLASSGIRSAVKKDKDSARRSFACLKRILLCGVIAFIILSPQFLPIILNRLKLSSVTVASAHNPYHRPFEDLFSQSARPLSYFLPAPVHPLFGTFTEQFVGSSLYGISFTEHTLYLGWVGLVLAVVAFRRYKKVTSQCETKWSLPEGDKSQVTGHKKGINSEENFYIGFFLFLALVGWFFSQPPWWSLGPVKIYMPSFFMYKILPMYRAYCRFGILVMLSVAVLAGFGLKYILEKYKGRYSKGLVTALLAVLALFEFWSWPPYKVIDLSRVPDAYYWLKEQPKDTVIAEYPLDIEGPNEMYKFYQITHHKKMINGTKPLTPAHDFIQKITDLSSPHSAGVLKWMGVKYVFVHRQDYLETESAKMAEELKGVSKNSGLKLVKSFPAQECPEKGIGCIRKTGPIDVYEVIAAAVRQGED